ncbi:uncharacterized [Tachysurus ichikawai]
MRPIATRKQESRASGLNQFEGRKLGMISRLLQHIGSTKCQLLCAELIKQQILLEPTEAGVASIVASEDLPAAEAGRKSEDPICIDPTVVAGSPLEEPMLALQLKQLDLELSHQQYQSQLLHLQTLELEAKKEIKLMELELRLVHGERPAYGPSVPPAPASPAPASPTPAPPVPLHESSTMLEHAYRVTSSVFTVYIRDQLMSLQQSGTLRQRLEIPKELRRKYWGCRMRKRNILQTPVSQINTITEGVRREFTCLCCVKNAGPDCLSLSVFRGCATQQCTVFQQE